MEVDKAMERLRHTGNAVTRPPSLQQKYLQETIRKRYGDETQFMHRFTIGHEKTYCTHVWRCVLGTAPTMGHVNAAYGGHTASAWQLAVAGNGDYLYVVCRSLEEFVREVEEYLQNKYA